MKIKAQFVGGPIDGQVIEMEEVSPFVHEVAGTKDRVVYVQKLKTIPKGPELAIAVYAPDTWDQAEFKEAFSRSLPGTKR